MIVKYRIGRLKGEIEISDTVPDEEAIKIAKTEIRKKMSYFPLGIEEWKIEKSENGENTENS